MIINNINNNNNNITIHNLTLTAEVRKTRDNRIYMIR